MLFLVLTAWTANNPPGMGPVDLFLVSDPLVAVVNVLITGIVPVVFLAVVPLVLLTALVGRVFCSHACPMGTLIDLGDRLFARRPRRTKPMHALRPVRIGLLLVVLGVAAAGVNLLAYVDPLVILDRFAAAVLVPVGALLAHLTDGAGPALHRALDLDHMSVPRHLWPAVSAFFAALALFASILLLSVAHPRFWCVYLCPLGGLLSWLGRFAPWRRRVSDSCISCGECVAGCPTHAIESAGMSTNRMACFDCRRCASVCPEDAIHFGLPTAETASAPPDSEVLPSRRAVVAGAALLAGTGALTALGVKGGILRRPAPPDSPPDPADRLIRPPGALPEASFIEQCVACGACQRVCPTGVLQPDWYRGGLEGLWAPRMVMRQGACDQGCVGCGDICPTGAIRPLPIAERLHARPGTARIDRERCIPWKRDERCIVCIKACPYGAIETTEHSSTGLGLPVVDPTRCNGCGLCERRCPVIGDAAILMHTEGQIRLAAGSYVEEANALGLRFETWPRARIPGAGSRASGGDER